MTDKAGALERLHQLLWLFGTANDADDHCRGPEEGRRIRQRATAGIREIIRDHPFVAEILPDLERALDTGAFEMIGWHKFACALEPEIRAARGGSIA